MDVELEEMEERVVYERDRAVDVFLDTEKEFERSSCLIAGWKRDIGLLASGVCDVLAGITEERIRL